MTQHGLTFRFDCGRELSRRAIPRAAAYEATIFDHPVGGPVCEHEKPPGDGAPEGRIVL